jgi:hypothetical protein
MRAPVALFLILLAAAALVSSCGKGQSSASTRTVTVQGSTGSSTQPSKPSTGGSTGGSTSAKTAKVQALAFARAVNLRPGDVPGYQAAPREAEGASTTEKHASSELQKCLGASGEQRPVVEVSSRRFERKASIAQVSVSSSVTVERSATIAGKELEAIHNPHTRSCFTSYFKALFSGSTYKGATIGPVKLESGTPPAAGTSGSFGWRLRTSLTVRSIPIPIELDILGFVEGRSEVALTTFGLAVPFPAPTEQQLFLLLLSRAKAQHLP